jgi:chromosome condensin MukBEF MukE localization factor
MSLGNTLREKFGLPPVVEPTDSATTLAEHIVMRGLNTVVNNDDLVTAITDYYDNLGLELRPDPNGGFALFRGDNSLPEAFVVVSNFSLQVGQINCSVITHD